MQNLFQKIPRELQQHLLSMMDPDDIISLHRAYPYSGLEQHFIHITNEDPYLSRTFPVNYFNPISHVHYYAHDDDLIRTSALIHLLRTYKGIAIIQYHKIDRFILDLKYIFQVLYVLLSNGMEVVRKLNLKISIHGVSKMRDSKLRKQLNAIFAATWGEYAPVTFVDLPSLEELQLTNVTWDPYTVKIPNRINQIVLENSTTFSGIQFDSLDYLKLIGNTISNIHESIIFPKRLFLMDSPTQVQLKNDMCKELAHLNIDGSGLNTTLPSLIDLELPNLETLSFFRFQELHREFVEIRNVKAYNLKRFEFECRSTNLLIDNLKVSGLEFMRIQSRDLQFKNTGNITTTDYFQFNWGLYPESGGSLNLLIDDEDPHDSDLKFLENASEGCLVKCHHFLDGLTMKNLHSLFLYESPILDYPYRAIFPKLDTLFVHSDPGLTMAPTLNALDLKDLSLTSCENVGSLYNVLNQYPNLVTATLDLVDYIPLITGKFHKQYHNLQIDIV